MSLIPVGEVPSVCVLASIVGCKVEFLPVTYLDLAWVLNERQAMYKILSFEKFSKAIGMEEEAFFQGKEA